MVHELTPEPDSPSFSPEQRRFVGMLLFSLALHLAVMTLIINLGVGMTRPAFFASSLEVSLEHFDAEKEYPREQTETDAEESSSKLSPDVLDDTPPTGLPEYEATGEVGGKEATQLPPPSSIAFSVSAGSFVSFGDGQSLRDELRPYFLEMLEMINRSWQEVGRGVILQRGAMLLISVDREGNVRGAKVVQSSGNRAHDRLLLMAVERSRFSPLPSSYDTERFEAPIRFTPPLSLLSLERLIPAPPPH